MHMWFYSSINIFIQEIHHAMNKIWWLCLVPTSATRSASGVWYRITKQLIKIYKEIILMNNNIKLPNIEWRTPYPLTNFEDRFGLREFF